MEKIKFGTLEECIGYYGRENLVAVDCLPQIIFYTTSGKQPTFIFENQNKPGKITCWYLKAETSEVYKKWLSNKKK